MSYFLQTFYGNVIQPFETKKMLEIISHGGVKGLVNITCGGFTVNIPSISLWTRRENSYWIMGSATCLQVASIVHELTVHELDLWCFSIRPHLIVCSLDLEAFNICHSDFCRLETLMMQRYGEHSIWASAWCWVDHVGDDVGIRKMIAKDKLSVTKYKLDFCPLIGRP